MKENGVPLHPLFMLNFIIQKRIRKRLKASASDEFYYDLSLQRLASASLKQNNLW